MLFKILFGFWTGFYLTTYPLQAEKWALRKAGRLGGLPIVSVYELNENCSAFRVQHFKEENRNWLDFVCSCRKGELIYQFYDMIIGRVADDDVFKTIDMYRRNLWDVNRTLQEMRYYANNDQICIGSQALIDQCLFFVESYNVVLP